MSRNTWRYQPVTLADGLIVLIEVHLAPDGTLRAWTQEPYWPCGNDVPDLLGELRRLSADAASWRPVPFSALQVGMGFEMVRQ